MAGFIGAAGFVGVVGIAECGGIAGIIHRNKKKFFSFFTLTPSQMWLKRPVYRGFKGEGKCEGSFLPSHHPHTLMDKSCYNRTKNELLIRLDIACKQIEKTVPEE